MALVGGQVHPLARLGAVLCHALADLVHQADLKLRLRHAAFGRHLVPLQGLGIVLG